MATDPAERFDSVADLAGALRTATAEYVGHRASLTAERLAAEVGDRLGRPGASSTSARSAAVRLGQLRRCRHRLLLVPPRRAAPGAGPPAERHALARTTPRAVAAGPMPSVTPTSASPRQLSAPRRSTTRRPACTASARWCTTPWATSRAQRRPPSASSSRHAALSVSTWCQDGRARWWGGPAGRGARSVEPCDPGLARFADAELAGLWTELEGETLDGTALRYWGMAHGWAGVLFGTFRWCERAHLRSGRCPRTTGGAEWAGPM